MSVRPAPRTAWHIAPPAPPGRLPVARRRPDGPPGAALVLTLSIPAIEEERLTAPVRRLLDAAREVLASGDPTVVVTAAPVEPRASAPAPAPARPGLHILVQSRSVLRDGEPLSLTRLEFDLLLHLAENPRRVFTRLQLLTAVWGYEHAGVRTVDVHVRRLRGKVGGEASLVTTVYGVGYRLADEARVTIDRRG